MTVEENKALLKRFYDEVINENNVDMIEDFVDSEIVDHNPSVMEQAEGLEGTLQAIAHIRQGFPDINFEIRDIIGEDDKLAVVLRITGTHQGEFWGIESTNKKIDTTIIDFFRFEDGKIAERWGLFDIYELMKQLGQAAA